MHPVVALPSIAAKPYLSKQYALMRRLQSTLLSEPDCLGAVVVGSVAEDRADHMSDVDFIVYCEPHATAQLFTTLSEVAADRPVVHRLQGRHDPSSPFERVILEDWSSYEIHVVAPSTRMRLRPPYVELINRRSYLETRLSEDKPIGRPNAKPYVNGDAGLVWELFNCVKWLRRGEIDFTAQYLQRLGEQLAHRSGATGGADPPLAGGRE
jgi:predicted nucleotidyltransferase